MDKFDRMYQLGVRGFGVFIDDMTFVPSSEMTAYLPAQVQAKLKAKYNTGMYETMDVVAQRTAAKEPTSLDDKEKLLEFKR